MLCWLIDNIAGLMDWIIVTLCVVFCNSGSFILQVMLLCTLRMNVMLKTRSAGLTMPLSDMRSAGYQLNGQRYLFSWFYLTKAFTFTSYLGKVLKLRLVFRVNVAGLVVRERQFQI